MSKIETIITSMGSIIDQLRDLPQDTPNIPKEVTEALKSIMINPKDIFILNDTHILRTSAINETLLLVIGARGDDLGILGGDATPDDFEIIEGMLAFAELGDLFIYDGDGDIHVVGFRKGDDLSLNYLDNHSIREIDQPETAQGIILRRKT